jgi:kumamolisin
MAETYAALAGHQRPPAPGVTRVRDVDPEAPVEVTIALKAPELPLPDASPAKPLTLAELRQNYGADPETIRNVESALSAHGLRSEGVGPTGRTLRVSGTAAAIDSAFQAGMGIYHSPMQGEFRGREGSVSVPSEIAGLVDAVIGLDQRQAVKRRIARPLAATQAPALTPAQVEAHYNFPPGDGAGQKIAIAEFGSPWPIGPLLIPPPAYFPDDLAAFCQQQGRPVPVVNTVAVNLAPLTGIQFQTLLPTLAPATKQGLENITTEVMMDVEIIASLCPAATISVFYATFDQKGVIDLVEQVIADQPVTLSISYGQPEAAWGDAARQAIDRALNAAALLGITVCVSSGDDGSGCHQGPPDQQPAPPKDDRTYVEFPASSRFVLAVGGTEFSAGQEVVWNDPPGQRPNGAATGGGVSALSERPPWQTIDIPSLNPDSIKGRIVPDVAGLAGSPGYLLLIYFEMTVAPGGLRVWGPTRGEGTSASTPMWAALLARINAALRGQSIFYPPLLYQNNVATQGFTDIVAGNNASFPNPGKGYAAGRGFDAVTGWGVPNGQELLAQLAKLLLPPPPAST